MTWPNNNTIDPMLLGWDIEAFEAGSSLLGGWYTWAFADGTSSLGGPTPLGGSPPLGGWYSKFAAGFPLYTPDGWDLRLSPLNWLLPQNVHRW